jgi:hypothetical protein
MTGCGLPTMLPGPTRDLWIQEISSERLMQEFRNDRTFWGRPNMEYVREIHRRGGFSDEVLARFEAGENSPDCRDLEGALVAQQWFIDSTDDIYSRRGKRYYGSRSFIRGGRRETIYYRGTRQYR